MLREHLNYNLIKIDYQTDESEIDNPTDRSFLGKQCDGSSTATLIDNSLVLL